MIRKVFDHYSNKLKFHSICCFNNFINNILEIEKRIRINYLLTIKLTLASPIHLAYTREIAANKNRTFVFYYYQCFLHMFFRHVNI